MKTGSNIFFFLITALTVISCDNKSYVREEVFCAATPSGDTITLDYNKSTPVFASCRENMHVKVTQVNDSRCPVDVTCIWAGKLSVVLQMDSAFTISLEPGIIKDTLYNSRYYSFQLVDVYPKPKANPPVTAGEQKITAIIKSGNNPPKIY
jgi:hypothetical protein